MFKSVCQICLNQGRNAHRCCKRFNKEFKTHSLRKDNKLYNNPLVHINLIVLMLVSGFQILVSHLISLHLALFDHFIAYTVSEIVMVGNGKHLPIHHTGNVNLHTSLVKITLYNVLHVPYLKQYLLSMSQFTSDLNCDLCFTRNGFVVTDRGSRRVILDGSKVNKLYQLNLLQHSGMYASKLVKIHTICGIQG